MPEQQKFEPIDRVFQDAFKDMSENPAPSGWDKPSPAVWEGIQSNLKRPNTSLRFPANLLLLSACLIAVGAIIWYVNSQTDAPAESINPMAPVETIAVPEATIDNSSTLSTAASLKPTRKATNAKEITANEQIGKNTRQKVDGDSKVKTGQQQPLNSVERNRMLESAEKKNSKSTPPHPDSID